MAFSLILVGVMLAAGAEAPGPSCGSNAQARALALLIIGHESQQREALFCNETLATAAAQRAKNLVEDPKADETTPNEVVRETGFRFPVFYPPVGNQVQAVANEMDSPESAIEYLAESFEHRDLVLGDGEFFSRQTELGVGYYPEGDGQGKYVVFIAEPYSNPGLVIKQEFSPPKMVTDEVCGKAWRSSRDKEFRNMCRKRWLERRDDSENQ
ncbi:MAG: hypothetical protein KJO85_06255 [Gammaproteobacteria bacterium]|nr:hypothetical protein [Gammaproteobacteria bacterium]